LAWEYETHTFNLLNGEVYVPDFWLPQVGVFLEVKGTGSGSGGSGDEHGAERLHKPWLLAHQLSVGGIDVLIKTGSVLWLASDVGWRVADCGFGAKLAKSLGGKNWAGQGSAVGLWRPSAELLSVIRGDSA
jgi:hypothetical protein